MSDIIVQKQQGQRVRGRPFRKGRSGNPAGRPPGARNRGAQFAETFLGDQAEALTRKAVELALGGDPGALRLCLERIVAPRRERTVRLPLPVMRDAAGLADAMAVVSAAARRHIPQSHRDGRFREAPAACGSGGRRPGSPLELLLIGDLSPWRGPRCR